MEKMAILPVAVLAVIGVASAAYYVFSGFGTSTATVVTPTTSQSATQQKIAVNNAYYCAKPAVNSWQSCDQLPTGYVIPQTLPNAPRPTRPAGMTDSAWSVLQKTWVNGFCDPNETVWSDPIDCAPIGALAVDPYTGRGGVAASICQVLP